MWFDFLYGSKIKLQELRTISEAVARVGLLDAEGSDANTFPHIATKLDKPQCKFPADTDSTLLLVMLRGAIELRLHVLARRMNLNSEPKGAKQLLRDLLRYGTLTDQEFDVLKRLITTLDSVANGSAVEPGAADWVVEVGPRLLTALEYHPVPPDLSEFGL